MRAKTTIVYWNAKFTFITNNITTIITIIDNIIIYIITIWSTTVIIKVATGFTVANIVFSTLCKR